jgi:phosphoribosylformimino-5-aminoimidazole carboxamide ribonucleotide (ProFAR) isomerase
VQLYPAIDLRLGRLARAGRPVDPLAIAGGWVRAGAAWLHVVDLDRVAGTGRNDDLVRALVALPGARIQLGGGLTAAAVAEALRWGVRRVVLGSGALATLESLVRELDPERLAVACDAPDATAAHAALARAVAAGIRRVVYRNRDRDGTLLGADVAGAGTLVGHGAEVIVAGGVASLEELRALRRAGVAGVIVGRALLDGRFTLAEAVACCG